MPLVQLILLMFLNTALIIYLYMDDIQLFNSFRYADMNLACEFSNRDIQTLVDISIIHFFK